MKYCTNATTGTYLRQKLKMYLHDLSPKKKNLRFSKVRKVLLHMIKIEQNEALANKCGFFRKQLGGLEAALGKCFNFYSRVNLEIVLPSLKLTQINA